MQPASLMRLVPPRKTPREGHSSVVASVRSRSRGLLCVRQPTGYGKTYAACAAFRALFEAGEVTRMLYLVPTATQRNQFCTDGEGELWDAGLRGPGVVPFDIAYSPAQALMRHRRNETGVFVATIQALATSADVRTAVAEMMTTGTWMVVVDEYHHYGVDKSWGRAALALPAQFKLAMSATPDRKEQDSAFGAPDVSITYRQAVEEKAVKRLVLHAYEYRIDAITVNGEPVSFTTSEVAERAGGTDPAKIDEFILRNKMRWSPKYISPLVSIPVERLIGRRGGYPLQMIVGAMGCLHAQMVCKQIQDMFGDILRVDWVGTGPNGRTDEQNAAIIAKFCPPKRDGKRDPKDIALDVLVHVGMAGEGLDSVFVSEVVHLNPANITNQNDQENGRAARRIPGAPEELQTAYVNVDSSSPYAEWAGSKIMDAFERDSVAGKEGPDEDDGPSDPRDIDAGEIPEEPHIVLADCVLENIDKGDPEVKGCAEALVAAGPLDAAVLDDPNHPIWDRALELRRRELDARARASNGMSTLAQLRQSVNDVVRKAAAVAARKGSSARPVASLIGDMMKRINGRMKSHFNGGVDMANEDGLRARYKWARSLAISIEAEGLPLWLR